MDKVASVLSELEMEPELDEVNVLEVIDKELESVRIELSAEIDDTVGSEEISDVEVASVELEVPGLDIIVESIRLLEVVLSKLVVRLPVNSDAVSPNVLEVDMVESELERLDIPVLDVNSVLETADVAVVLLSDSSAAIEVLVLDWVITLEVNVLEASKLDAAEVDELKAEELESSILVVDMLVLSVMAVLVSSLLGANELVEVAVVKELVPLV